jgi:uncharacterized protein (TIGR02231 family)
MKLLFMLSAILVISISSFANTKSKITNVVVYQRGAKITREATIKIQPGNNEIIISDLTTRLNGNSLQVKMFGSAILLSARTQTRTLENNEIPKRTKTLEDSLKLINTSINWLNSQRQVYQGEEKLIEANQNLRSEKEAVSVEEIIRLSEFYRTRLLDIRKKIHGIDNEIVELNHTKARINIELNKLRYSEKKYVGEVVLNVSSKLAQTQKVQISYLINEAGWSPIYDVRAKAADEPLQLIYKANVFQSTGINWDKIQLTVSTGNPTANTNRPVLYPWYIDFSHSWGNDKIISKQKAMATENLYQRSMAPEVIADEEVMEEAAIIPYTVEETTNRMSAEYKIDIEQDIPSDGKPHMVAMQEYELNSSFTYHCVPKLDRSAYLLAKIADYGQFNLLPGQSNLFFEGMYLGQSYLNPVTTVDSMLLSLGQDDKINIKRTQLQDFTSKQVVGSNVKESRAFEISVRNNNTFDIEIEVLDQLPISKQKEIEVKPIEIDGAKYDANYGSLLWTLKLKPGETKIVKFSYSVKYPKDTTISGF